MYVGNKQNAAARNGACPRYTRQHELLVGLLCTPRGLPGSSAVLGLEGDLELSAGLRFRGEAFDGAFMSTRTVAAVVWKRARVRV